VKLRAYCQQCGNEHPIDFDPACRDSQMDDWLHKHFGHAGVGFDWPGRTTKPGWVDKLRRWWKYLRSPLAAGAVAATPLFTGPLPHQQIPEWARAADQRPSAQLAFLPNANIKIAYGASAAPTLTLASLAASSTLLAGRESSSVSNTSNLYVDYYTGGWFKQAATNTAAGTIKVAVVGAINDTPTWPDVFDGTDSVETVTSQAIYDACCRVIASIATAATANAVNPFAPVGMAQYFGYVLPTAFDYFVSHNAQTSTNAWSATEGDHTLKYTPVYFTAV
jgi:hypothetical protein